MEHLTEQITTHICLNSLDFLKRWVRVVLIWVTSQIKVQALMLKTSWPALLTVCAKSLRKQQNSLSSEMMTTRGVFAGLGHLLTTIA